MKIPSGSGAQAPPHRSKRASGTAAAAVLGFLSGENPFTRVGRRRTTVRVCAASNAGIAATGREWSKPSVLHHLQNEFAGHL